MGCSHARSQAGEFGDTGSLSRSQPSTVATLTQVLHIKWPTGLGSTRRGQLSTTGRGHRQGDVLFPCEGAASKTLSAEGYLPR